MSIALIIVHRYVAPALAGICVAAAAASDGIAGTAVMMVVALSSVYVSSRVGARLLAHAESTES